MLLLLTSKEIINLYEPKAVPLMIYEKMISEEQNDLNTSKMDPKYMMSI